MRNLAMPMSRFLRVEVLVNIGKQMSFVDSTPIVKAESFVFRTLLHMVERVCVCVVTSSIDWLPTAAPNPAFNHVQSTLSVATTVHAHMRARSLQQLLLERHGLRVVFEHVSTIMYVLHRGDCVPYRCIVSVSLATTFQC